MRKILLKLILVFGLLLFAFYNFPVSRPSFDNLYQKVDQHTRTSLARFRANTKKKSIDIDGNQWNYIHVGKGSESILFLHGMTGSYDIWWQQIQALSDTYRIISLTYPPISNLKELGEGVATILAKEGITKTHVIGSSLGGYFAQYLLSQKPSLIQKAIFSNTFPPNNIISEKNATIGKLLPFVPEWIVMKILQGNTEKAIYPAAGNSELVKAFILEQSYGMMSKKQFVSRFYCVIDKFTPADLTQLGKKVMIIEADNDPLVEAKLRTMLKSTYPNAAVKTLSNVGHFPYLNEPEVYTSIIRKFFNTKTN